MPSQGAEVASTYLKIKDVMNATSSDNRAYQAVVMYQGDNGGLVVDGWWGNATSWDRSVDTSGSPGLKNLEILPIDYMSFLFLVWMTTKLPNVMQVLAFPPSLSEAFDTPGYSISHPLSRS